MQKNRICTANCQSHCGQCGQFEFRVCSERWTSLSQSRPHYATDNYESLITPHLERACENKTKAAAGLFSRWSANKRFISSTSEFRRTCMYTLRKRLRNE